ncbi:nucleotidyltransferase domain-containing protein [Candidatus Bipolaricaulota bacterium]|nr:nucleotidyltransferase domain-containing protein [Candidatus Bipolaricaulota bacterium]
MKRSVKALDLEKLSVVFRRYPEIQAVYVFGSVALGKAHRESDLDLSIVSRDNTFRRRKLDLLAELARQGFCNVDLVFLDTEDIVLQYEAIRQNQVIYSTEDFDRGSFYSEVVRRYLDFQPYLRVQRDAYKQRLIYD